MSKDHGDRAEAYVVARIRCPNCKARLFRLPQSFPMYDVQCSKCLFRAQVKSASCKPKSQIFGGGWSMMEKNLRTGHFVPPLIVTFRWRSSKGATRHVVMFFPFLTRENLRKRTRSDNGSHPGYKEFNYVNLLRDDVPRRVLQGKLPAKSSD
jgi:hypothetical protein